MAGDVAVVINKCNGQKCANFPLGTSRLALASAISAGNVKSYSFWVNFRSSGAGTSRYCLVGNKNIVYVSSSNNWATNVGGSAVSLVYAVAYNTWINVIVIQTATTWDFYINGVLIKQISTTNTSTFQYLGENSTAGIRGMIRDVRFYSTELTALEIEKISTGGHITNNLIYSWDLKEDANASVGNANFTTNNSVFFANFDMLTETSIRTNRVGAGDKFFNLEINGSLLTSVIQE